MNNPQLIRLAIISDTINRKIYPSKLTIAQILSVKTGTSVCMSQLEKDMKLLKDDYDAPIKYNKREDGYYYELSEGEKYCFKKALIERLTI